MTTATDLLADGFERTRENVAAVLDGATAQQLVHRPGPEANPVAWLVWHLTRVQDAQVADVVGAEQVWHSEGFAERFALPYEEDATGYGQSAAEVGAFPETEPALLAEYHAAVHEMTLTVLRGLSEEDLDRVIDPGWDPPVTVAVRLVSVMDDVAQHVGQAAYARGLLT